MTGKKSSKSECSLRVDTAKDSILFSDRENFQTFHLFPFSLFKWEMGKRLRMT
jgi:hypothetical protein